MQLHERSTQQFGRCRRPGEDTRPDRPTQGPRAGRPFLLVVGPVGNRQDDHCPTHRVGGGFRVVCRGGGRNRPIRSPGPRAGEAVSVHGAGGQVRVGPTS